MDVGCVRENSGGVVVGSVEEMASAAVELLNDPQRRERLARDGRATAAERHNWDRIAETYEKQCFLVTQAVGRQEGIGA
jgi:glycosyltransferase involved in cell wall biosynthesis